MRGNGKQTVFSEREWETFDIQEELRPDHCVKVQLSSDDVQEDVIGVKVCKEVFFVPPVVEMERERVLFKRPPEEYGLLSHRIRPWSMPMKPWMWFQPHLKKGDYIQLDKKDEFWVPVPLQAEYKVKYEEITSSGCITHGAQWSTLEIFVRHVMSVFVNHLIQVILVYSLPLVLCTSETYMDFVLNAAATIFIIELDDTEGHVVTIESKHIATEQNRHKWIADWDIFQHTWDIFQHTSPLPHMP